MGAHVSGQRKLVDRRRGVSLSESDDGRGDHISRHYGVLKTDGPKHQRHELRSRRLARDRNSRADVVAITWPPRSCRED